MYQAWGILERWFTIEERIFPRKSQDNARFFCYEISCDFFSKASDIFTFVPARRSVMSSSVGVGFFMAMKNQKEVLYFQVYKNSCLQIDARAKAQSCSVCEIHLLLIKLSSVFVLAPFIFTVLSTFTGMLPVHETHKKQKTRATTVIQNFMYGDNFSHVFGIVGGSYKLDNITRRLVTTFARRNLSIEIVCKYFINFISGVKHSPCPDLFAEVRNNEIVYGERLRGGISTCNSKSCFVVIFIENWVFIPRKSWRICEMMVNGICIGLENLSVLASRVLSWDKIIPGGKPWLQ